MVETKWITGEDDLSEVYMIRRRVFIEEQHIEEEIEMDGTDHDSIHLLIYEDRQPVATGRIRIINGQYTLGRIAVLPEHRRRKLGDLVVRLLIRHSCEIGGWDQYIHAQKHAQGFYEAFGFEAYGEEFDEAGIPHIKMKRTGNIFGTCQAN